MEKAVKYWPSIIKKYGLHFCQPTYLERILASGIFEIHTIANLESFANIF